MSTEAGQGTASTTVSALRMRVQVEWERAMDNFFEALDRLSYRSTEIEEADVLRAVQEQIDEDTADEYQRWIDG